MDDNRNAELEHKFLVNRKNFNKALSEIDKVRDRKKTRFITNIYFDTDDLNLYNNGITLRIRKEIFKRFAKLELKVELKRNFKLEYLIKEMNHKEYFECDISKYKYIFERITRENQFSDYYSKKLYNFNNNIELEKLNMQGIIKVYRTEYYGFSRGDVISFDAIKYNNKKTSYKEYEIEYEHGIKGNTDFTGNQYYNEKENPIADMNRMLFFFDEGNIEYKNNLKSKYERVIEKKQLIKKANIY